MGIILVSVRDHWSEKRLESVCRGEDIESVALK
jgi:hypothetical protein